MILMQALQFLRRRRARQDLTAFDALIATNAVLTDGFTLPANGYVMTSNDVELTAVTDMITANDRTLSMDAAAADEVRQVAWLERGVVINKASGATGTVSVYVRDAFGMPHKIAEG